MGGSVLDSTPRVACGRPVKFRPPIQRGVTEHAYNHRPVSTKRNMTTTAEAGRKGGLVKASRMDSAKRKAHAKRMNDAKALKKAKAIALVSGTERIEGIKD